MWPILLPIIDLQNPGRRQIRMTPITPKILKHNLHLGRTLTENELLRPWGFQRALKVYDTPIMGAVCEG